MTPRQSEAAVDATPSLIDLVHELREAVGLFSGAMPITPKAAWEEAIDRVVSERNDNKRLREAIEGKWDRFDQDGEAVLPRAWTLIDGGRYDELEAIEREYESERDRRARAETALRELGEIVGEMAEDEGLWFIATTAPEAYLQQELRRLHAVIECAALTDSDSREEPVE